MYSNNLETFKQKKGAVDLLLEEFGKIQGCDFCFGVRQISVDRDSNGLFTGFLVLECSTWGYQTARNPEAFAEVVKKLNKAEGLSSKDLHSLATRINLYMAEKVGNVGYLSRESYLPSKEAALVLALSQHLENCTHPGHCGWDLLTKDLK